MEREQRALESYVKLHGHKLKGVVRSEPTAFLVPYTERGVWLDATMTAYGVEQVKREFDTEDATVRFLLHQMHTYDPSSCNILGLIFDTKTVLAHVVQCGAIRETD